MNRIFLGLSCVAITLLCANLYVGLTGGDYNGVSSEYVKARTRLDQARSSLATSPESLDRRQSQLDEVTGRLREIQRPMRLHVLLGVLAALVAVLVNSLCVTYFIGTGRWCKEVSETYRLDERFDQQARRLKRRTFPWSILGIVTVLSIVAFGAAADPGSYRPRTDQWVMPHLLAAVAGTVVMAIAFWFQHAGIEANFANIERVMQEVQRIREAKGLDDPQAAVPPHVTNHAHTPPPADAPVSGHG